MAWLTVQEAHRRLNGAVSLTTVYRLVHSALVGGTKVRGRVLIDEASLDDYLRRMGFAVIAPPAPRPSYCDSKRRPTHKEWHDSF